MGTRETQSVLHKGVCDNKSINDELLQKTLKGSDQLIVVKKQGNACGAKGLARETLGQGHICQKARIRRFEVNRNLKIQKQLRKAA